MTSETAISQDGPGIHRIIIPIVIAVGLVVLLTLFVLPHMGGPTETVGWLA